MTEMLREIRVRLNGRLGDWLWRLLELAVSVVILSIVGVAVMKADERYVKRDEHNADCKRITTQHEHDIHAVMQKLDEAKREIREDIREIRGILLKPGREVKQ